jgi:signal transduction histidine kinase
MIEWTKIFRYALLAFWVSPSFATDHPAIVQQSNIIEIQSVTVKGESVSLSDKDRVYLGRNPEDISISFGPAINSDRVLVRVRYKLEGYDTDWRANGAEMSAAVRFFNDEGDLVNQRVFPVSGKSADWNGSLETSPLTHRRETLVVPPQASRIMFTISSAGPPACVGIYVVANLAVSKLSGNLLPVLLLQFPFELESYDEMTNQLPYGWMRDGTRPSMAKIVKIGQEPVTEAFAILDDSLISHAEWHNELEQAPQVTPGDQLLIEWNEMFSIGLGDTLVATYSNLPPGNFNFRVEAVNVMGIPTGVETSLAVLVPPPFWRTFWFWGSISVITVVLATAIGRYIVLRQIRLETLRLEKQHMLEQERMRIAHDIHDDLGARVTQISLVSAMARANTINLEQARAEFDQISEMSRDLVAALYETVWAVNPENDNLNELGVYIFQLTNKLCGRAQCCCRCYLQDLPREITVSSQIRHNVCMAVKEAINNVIRHAHASEVTVRVSFIDGMLTISIQDDGCGFQPAENIAGHGLKNLKQRLKNIGGDCQIESRPGHGTTIQFHLKIKPAGFAA